jgi:hypothetical protein
VALVAVEIMPFQLQEPQAQVVKDLQVVMGLELLLMEVVVAEDQVQ